MPENEFLFRPFYSIFNDLYQPIVMKIRVKNSLLVRRCKRPSEKRYAGKRFVKDKFIPQA